MLWNLLLWITYWSSTQPLRHRSWLNHQFLHLVPPLAPPPPPLPAIWQSNGAFGPLSLQMPVWVHVTSGAYVQGNPKYRKQCEKAFISHLVGMCSPEKKSQISKKVLNDTFESYLHKIHLALGRKIFFKILILNISYSLNWTNLNYKLLLSAWLMPPVDEEVHICDEIISKIYAPKIAIHGCKSCSQKSANEKHNSEQYQ